MKIANLVYHGDLSKVP